MIRIRPAEERIVLEDANGSKTYFDRDLALAGKRGERIFPMGASEREIFADGRSRNEFKLSEAGVAAGPVFFNSSLFALFGAADASEDALAHPQAVAAYTRLLADAMGYTGRSTLDILARGALLHDIGKAGLPARILNKTGALTAVEREIVMEHPAIGFRIVSEFGLRGESASIVLCHHERYDGRGYPYGLAGEEIPEGARIFALADTLDAITSNRPYRKGRSFAEAVRDIAAAGGSQFDPAVVEVFLTVPVEMWIEAGREARAKTRPPAVS